MLRWLSMVSLTLGLAACQSNTVKLEFEDDGGSGSTGMASTTGADGGPTTVTMTTAVDTSADTGVTPGGPATLLMAIDTPLAPGLPFQAIVTTVPGAGTVDLTLQFLSLDIGSTTTPRQLVGDQYGYPGVPVDDAGGFIWEIGVILVPAAANPITGTDTVVSLSVAARAEGSPYCGEIGGVVLMPTEVPLDGSTHAMTQVPDATQLPVDFPTSCPI